MATKKELKWSTLIGAAAGALITYNNTNEDCKDRFWKIVGGAFVGGAVGYTAACLFGEQADTTNYTLYNKKGNRVYEGITFADRLKKRLAEHKANGKPIHTIKSDVPKPRSEALILEMYRIKRYQPKLNIQCKAV